MENIIGTEPQHLSPPIELWGGIECTVNRVGDRYFDQLERSGHAARIEDLERFAQLGIRTLRYPLLWERIAPEGLERADWSWADERMAALRSLGITPIVGLLHHGSGPRSTSLLDPEFPEKLAAFARAVAERYPWIGSYTPINEPLTTARFSALYGLWYPHEQDNALFARAQIHQCQGIVMAMRAIREINPDAKLVQTEDLGKTHSTPTLAYQAAMENERRWLTVDMLCGRLDRHHPMWPYYFRDLGRDESRLDWLREYAMAPDIIGINHYLTSERFIDERLHHYPEHTHGGNGIHDYADVEAVRVLAAGSAGPRALLREAWERYQIPLAVTEVHLGCTREEQMRWLAEIWNAAHRLREDGVDLRAVTAWSLLGAHDWQCLLTRDEGFYENGAFDIRAPKPRPTAIARMIADLAAGREHRHPVLEARGWWQRPMRLLYPAWGEHPTHIARPDLPFGDVPGGKLLITGGAGVLARAFERACAVRAIPCVLLSRIEMDCADPGSVERALARYRPWGVINAAGYTDIDAAEREPERCRRENVHAVQILAAACEARGIPLVSFSADQVFDGQSERPYVERDQINPLSVYGRSKGDSEGVAGALIIRAGAFFGPWDECNLLTHPLRMLALRRHVNAAEDQLISPTYLPDLTNAVLDLLIDGESGIWHLANQGEISHAGLIRWGGELAGLDPRLVQGQPTRMLGRGARRPHYSVLTSERGVIMPTLDHAMRRYIAERWRDGVSRGVHARRVVV